MSRVVDQGISRALSNSPRVVSVWHASAWVCVFVWGYKSGRKGDRETKVPSHEDRRSRGHYWIHHASGSDCQISSAFHDVHHTSSRMSVRADIIIVSFGLGAF